MYTESEVRKNLGTNPAWAQRAMVVLFQRQTQQEQDCNQTIACNGVGFNASDGGIGAYLAKWVMRGNTLSGEWLRKAFKIAPKYTKQIMQEIRAKKERENT